MKWYYNVLLGLALLSSGCSSQPDELEQKALLLTNGMSKTAVSNLFSGFPVIAAGKGSSMYDPTTLFQTNQPSASWISYSIKPRTNFFSDPLWRELCEIRFDTNDIIIGHDYHKGD